MGNFLQIISTAFKVLAFLERATPMEATTTTYNVGGEKFTVTQSAVTSATPPEGAEPVSIFTVAEFLISAISTIMVTKDVSQTFWVQNPLGGDIDVTLTITAS